MNGPDPLPEPDIRPGGYSDPTGYTPELVQRLVQEAYDKGWRQGVADAPGAGIIDYDVE